MALCDGLEQPLKKTGTRFIASVTSRCEGSGYVRVALEGGATVDCPVGYVTSVEDRWSFEVRGRSCTVIEDASG